MATMKPYGVAIRDAISKGDTKKMQSLLKSSKAAVKDHADLVSAYMELQEALEKLQKKS